MCASDVSTAASLPSASTRIASRKLQFSSHLAPAILLHHAGAKGRIPSPKIWVWPDRSLPRNVGGAREAPTAVPPRSSLGRHAETRTLELALGEADQS
jgi:hypothetical protein